MVIDDAKTFTVSVNNTINPLKIVTLINGTYTEYNPNPTDLQTAVTTINANGGELWLPDTTQTGEITTTHFSISHNNIKVHGWGLDKTVLHFTDSTYGIRASENPVGSGRTWARWGLLNTQFDNFKFTGSSMQLCVRKTLILENILAEDIQYGNDQGSSIAAGIRIVCPAGNSSDGVHATSTGHYWTGSIDGMCEDVRLTNCHANRTALHGFMFNSVLYTGLIFGNPAVSDDILLEGCTARRGGNWATGTGGWSLGFDLYEPYDEQNIPDSCTMQNMTINNCEAYESWESGFHFEGDVKKLHIHFNNCISNCNGRKYKETTDPENGDEAWTNPYGAGYLHSYRAKSNSDTDMIFTNCEARNNGAWGWRTGGTSCPSFINCIGNAYPTVNGNGYWTRTKMKEATPVGGISRPSCSIAVDTNTVICD